MIIRCNECNSFILECEKIRAIDLRCPSCNARHSNLMYNDIDSPLDFSKPPEIINYIKTK